MCDTFSRLSFPLCLPMIIGQVLLTLDTKTASDGTHLPVESIITLHISKTNNKWILYSPAELKNNGDIANDSKKLSS